MHRLAIASLVFSGFVALSLAADTSVESDYDWQLPAGYPQPIVPAENPVTPQKVALGKALFSDTRLSLNATLSCASCHDPGAYFSDGLPKPSGAENETLPFNTPTLWNSAYSASFSWIDKGFESLEQQHVGPLTNSAPVELGLGAAQLHTLSKDTELFAMLKQAFPAAERFTQQNLIASLASYVRTLIRGDSAFDRYLFADDPNALSAEAVAGLALFNSSRLNCVACHRGFLLSGPTRSVRAQFPPSFYRTGVSGSVEPFRVPSLKFVQHTAPYMHDGSQQTLDEVIDFYAAGGVSSETNSDSGHALGPKAAERIKAFELTAAERQALLAFLRSL